MSIHKVMSLAGLALVLAAAGPAVAGAEAGGGERTVKGYGSGTDTVNVPASVCTQSMS
jgi:hypothetical protein